MLSVQTIKCIAYINKSDRRERVYMSQDTSVDDSMEIQISVLNSIITPSFPLHKLKLKIASVIMLLRNILSPKLCNGTRVTVTNLQKNIMAGKTLGGTYRGD